MTMYYSNLDLTFALAQAAKWAAEEEEKKARDRKIREKADLSMHGIGPHLAAKLD